MAPNPTPLVPKPQALRYRRGKLPQGAPAPSDSDSSGSEDDEPRPQKVTKVDPNLVAGGAGRVLQTGNKIVPRNVQIALRDRPEEQPVEEEEGMS
jgi:microfibrillar-associated protein 1